MAFDELREANRQRRTGDDKFYKNFVYYFELKVPAAALNNGQGSGVETYVYPLVINPQEYELEEPSALSTTPTQGGGLYVEENGIVMRNLRIRGNTGFKPRRFLGKGEFLKLKALTNKSYTREFPPRGWNIDELSGHKHFQFLQDVMRTYNDLKQNPEFAEDTELYFHIPKDDEHWRVATRQFKLTKSANSTTLYRYEIDLLVMGPAEASNVDFSEDRDLIEKLKSPLVMMRSATNIISGSIRDLTNMTNDIAVYVKDIGTVLDGMTNIVTATSEFVNGVTRLVDTPIETFNGSVALLDNAIETLETAIENGENIPDSLVNNMRRMKDGANQIRAFPELIRSEETSPLSVANKREELSTTSSKETLEAAAAETPPNSFQEWLAVGTGNLPGDLSRSEGELFINKDLARYSSTFEYALASGDTLPSLAARFLGDARRWRHIADTNDLLYPYIDDSGLPGTKGIGDVILPSNSTAPASVLRTPVVGPQPDVSAEERVLGVDLLLARCEGPGDRFDLVVDKASGNEDISVVKGIPNLKQALLTRLRTERGTDLLYRNVGVDTIVGSAIPAIDEDQIQTKFSQAIEADPRISSVRQVTVQNSSADAIVLDAVAEVIGVGESTPLKLEV